MKIFSPHIPGTAELFLRIVLACVCGFSIGLERSKRFKEAGLRTHILTCFASALFMVISKYGFADIAAQGIDKPADYARIAAGVVTGVSFLCAGVILRIGSSVHGLTTAVGLWLTAGIGLSIGAGMYVTGISSTVLMVVTQTVLHHITFGHDSFTYSVVNITVEKGFDFEHLRKLVVTRTGGVIEDVAGKHGPETVEYEFVLRTRNEISSDEWAKIMELKPGIISISHKSTLKS